MADLNRDSLAAAPALNTWEISPEPDADAGKCLDIRRLINSKNKDVGYFIINTDLQCLAINESAIGINLIAGPLPDFAVITIGRIPLFWWRTQAARYYTPDSPSKFVPSSPTASDLSQQPGNQVDEETPRSWDQILDQGLRRHTSAKGDDRNQDFYQIETLSSMEYDGLWLAIGSLWEALRRLPSNELFAYGDERLFMTDNAESPDDFYQVPGPRRRFIIPLVLEANHTDKHYESNKDGNGAKNSTDAVSGHFMLVVAQITKQRMKDHIQLEFYDSRSVSVSEEIIRDQARAVVINSKWTRSKFHANSRIPPYARYKTLKVPKQRGINLCGFYTILNAWMIMLGLPMRHSTSRLRRTTHQEFANQGLEIINLALAGHMDSRTIQAFMNVHGYCVLQDPMDERDCVKHDVNAVSMSVTRLDGYLQDQRERDIGLTSRNPSPNGQSQAAVSPPEETVSGQVMNEDHDRQPRTPSPDGQLQVAESPPEEIVSGQPMNEDHIAVLMAMPPKEGPQISREDAEEIYKTSGYNLEVAASRVREMYDPHSVGQ